MEDTKGRDDDSSESSYCLQALQPEAGSGLKELVRGAKAGVYTNGSTGRPWGKSGLYTIGLITPTKPSRPGARRILHFFARPRPGNYHNDQTMTTTTTITTTHELL